MDKPTESRGLDAAASAPAFTDGVLREVWSVKDRIAQRYGYDLKRIAEAARQRSVEAERRQPRP